MTQTPLIFAATSGNIDVVQALLHAGADVNEVENDSWSAILVAAFKNFEDIAIMLIDNGANPFVESVQGISAAFIAQEREQKRVLEAIERWQEHRKFVDSLNTRLLDAALSVDVDAVSQLLAAGADPSYVNSAGYSPLIGASRSGCLGCVRLLLQAGADVNHR